MLLYAFILWVELFMPYLSAKTSDGQAEHAGHLAVVDEFEAGLGSSPDQDFVENKPFLIPDVNAFRVAKLLRGELTAVLAHMVFLEDGSRVQLYTWETKKRRKESGSQIKY